MKARSSTQRIQRGNTVSGLLIGLIIGVVIAAGVAVFINFGPKPFTTPKTDAAANRPASTSPNTPATPIALPGKPGDQPVAVKVPSATDSTPVVTSAATQSAPAEKPKFDFYDILPGGSSAPAPAAKPSEPAASSSKVVLQAGAFQNPTDADNLKARLAFAGVEAKVQRVDLGEKGIFYRVRLGPYDSQGDAETVRARLASEGIETSIMRSTSSASPSASAKR